MIIDDGSGIACCSVLLGSYNAVVRWNGCISIQRVYFDTAIFSGIFFATGIFSGIFLNKVVVSLWFRCRFWLVSVCGECVCSEWALGF